MGGVVGSLDVTRQGREGLKVRVKLMHHSYYFAFETGVSCHCRHSLASMVLGGINSDLGQSQVGSAHGAL